MADVLLNLQPYTLSQEDQCFTTKQALFTDITDYIKAVLPYQYQFFIISDVTPAVANQDKVWIKTYGDGSIKNIMRFTSGEWIGLYYQQIGREIVLNPSATVHPDFLRCNGQVVSKAQYPVLYSRIGDTYDIGGGDADNFQLPEFRSMFPVGAGQGPVTGTTSRALGQRGGEETHILTISEMPSHTHTLGSNGQSVPDLASWPNNSGSLPVGGAPYNYFTYGVANANGGGNAHNNIPPCLALNFDIRAIE